jgi:putative transposase
MKKSRFTDSQIIAILKQAEAGTPAPALCREHGISSATFYKWRAKFGGMDASLMARMKELEDENRRLKKMVAEERLKAEIVTEALQKSGEAILPTRDGPMGSPAQIRQYHPGLRRVRHQPDMLPLCAQAVIGEPRNRRLAHTLDQQPEKLGLWPVLSVSAQCEGLWLESQAGVSHLSGVGAAPAD